MIKTADAIVTTAVLTVNNHRSDLRKGRHGPMGPGCYNRHKVIAKVATTILFIV